MYAMAMTARLQVDLRNGRAILVERAGDEIRISVAGEWEERLRREEAWELAETLDAVSTGATPEPPGPAQDSNQGE